VPASNAVEVSGSSATATENAVALLAAAADPVRWMILLRLTAGQTCVCELQAEVAVAPNLLSYHLKVLRDADLVTCARRGRWIDYQLAGDAMERLTAALPGRQRTEP
jgi:ArsR family transcriptional regulator